MKKFAVITVIIILSFFINLLYYTCWMLTDHWLLESDTSTGEASTSNVVIQDKLVSTSPPPVQV